MNDEAAIFASHGDDGKINQVFLQSTESGALATLDRHGIELVHIETGDHGGLVRVSDKYGEPEAAIGVDESGDGFVFP